VGRLGFAGWFGGPGPRTAPADAVDKLGVPVRAAGAVLWRRAAGPGASGIEVALVHRPKYDDWSLPKGKIEPGEHATVAAVREVLEETGFEAVLGRELGVQSYAVKDRLKLVRYWAAEARGGRFAVNREVDRIAWLPPDEVTTLMTHGRDAKLAPELTSGPYATVPVIVLRHCGAVARGGEWDGDADRPLTAAGRVQAERLAGILAAFGRAAVLSSPSLRCLETVDPYCRATGTAVEVLPALSEDGHADRASAAGDLIRHLVADGSPVVVCSHRPVLPALLGAAGQAAQPGRSRGELLLPGEFVVLHTAGGAVAAADRHAPYPIEG
jgi:broad specificity phosphatase PhoE/8-oxo-dGTP pyrophosphatase MutT (NUDIX family)